MDIEEKDKSKCPDCGSRNTRDFENGCTLIRGRGVHHMCNNCRTLWSDEYIEKLEADNG